ncbi:RNA polymerase I specific transcription initiation factor domain-containing protein [Sarocladium implicatum]|nr:RNA polymerase I specific transcription initiation factor domain-containing protein [Sarocladium implicatum]
MTNKTPSNEWGDLDSDDIASIASDELHTHRPNRWTGPPSTWRNLTKDERMLWQSMEKLRNEDLGVHLYNSFALKRQGREPEGRKFLTVQTDDGKDAVWAPPKAWTAWPIKPNELPGGGLLKQQPDEHDNLTFSRDDDPMPSTDLQDEINAHILRTAKKRFRRRMDKASKAQGPVFASIEGPSAADATAPSSPASDISYTSGRSTKRGSVPISGVSDMDLDDEDEDAGGGRFDRGASLASSKSRIAAGPWKKAAQPQVTADDEHSEELLRAPVRHILSQLDKTLMVLHHGRTALINHMSDDSDSELEEGSRRGSSSIRGSSWKRGSRSRSRSRRRSQSATPAPPTPGAAPGTTRRGRPKKVHIPRDGETQEEMELRIARESHRAKPTTVAKRRDEAFEAWLKEGEEHARIEQGRGRRESTSGATTDEEGKGWREQKIDRIGLRDWSDVVNAAALAGFSEEVVERTAKRCAKLFGEGILMRTLPEAPAGQGSGVVERRFHPDQVDMVESDVDEEDLKDVKSASTSLRPSTSRRASTSRRSSVAPRAGTTRSPTPSHRRFPFPSTMPPHIRSTTPASPSHSRSRSRSRSRSSVPDMFCPEPSCPRSTKGFDRRANLERHVRLVHGGRKVEDWEVDSDEEVVGGVRVDGFLKEVVPESGWFRRMKTRDKERMERAEAMRKGDEMMEDGGAGLESD